MKKINRNYFLRAFGLACGFFLCASLTPAMAQDDVDTDDEEVVAKKRVIKAGPTYQMQQVSGVILDAATKQPISGVRVQALNDIRYTAMTGEDGRYTISVPVFVTALYISTPEYNPVQIPVRTEPQTTNLYSSVFKSFYKDGNVTFRNQEQTIENSSAITVENDIENSLNGVVRTISRGGMPGQGAAMFINGLNSLNTVAQPLIVIDGVVMDMQYDRKALHDGFINNVLSTYDVEDIENVRILNNGTALYGAKGGNGVIEITTKRGHSMATRIGVRIYGGVESTPNTIDMMNGNQYRSYMSEILGTYTGATPALTQSTLQSIMSQPFMNEDPNYTYYKIYHNNQDWQKDMYSSAVTQNYRINVQGGDEIAMYALSLGYTMADATAKKNDFSRLNIRFNTDINMFENFTTSFDISYAQATYNLRDNGWAESYDRSNISSPNVLGLLQAPMLSKYGYFLYWDAANQANALASSDKVLAGKNSDSDDPEVFGFGAQYGTDALANPYWILLNGQGDNKNYQDQMQFSLNINPRYDITPWLTIGDRFAYVMNRTSEVNYLPYNGTHSKFVSGVGNVRSTLKTQFGDESTIYNNLYLQFHRTMGAHTLNATAGFRLNSFDYSDSYTRGYNNQNDKTPNLVYSSNVTYGGTNDRWINLAYYLDAQYNFKNRYYLDATLTAESSSRFGKSAAEGVKLFGVTWGLFPALRAAWVVSNESWFKTKAINYLKLSAGYEESGNDNIDYYAARTYFANVKFMERATALRLENIANQAIQWETTHRLNAGVETSLLDNRLTLGLNLYWSKTSNLLARQNVSYLTGLPSVWSNNGAMTNKGLDVTANGVIVNSDKFKWQLGFSVGHYTNEITALPTSEIKHYDLNADGSRGSLYRTIQGYTSSIYGKDNVLTAIGNAAGVFYGYQTKGVFASDAEAAKAGNPALADANGDSYLLYPTGYVGDPSRKFKGGDVHFVDQNGDGWISEADLVEIGNPNPDIYGNIFTSVNFLKNFTLDVIFKYSLGNDIYNYQASQIEGSNNLWNQSKAVVNRWTHTGQITDMPRAVLAASSEWVNNERFSDRWIEDGSYLKMKKIRLTYALPLSLSWLQGLTIWGEANNLFTLTKYRGTDPEVSCGNSVLYQGIDAGLLPTSRSFNLGVTINL